MFLLVYVHLSVGTSNIFFAWAQQLWTGIYENIYTELKWENYNEIFKLGVCQVG